MQQDTRGQDAGYVEATGVLLLRREEVTGSQTPGPEHTQGAGPPANCVPVDGRRGPGPSVHEPGHVSGRRSLGAGPAGWFQGMCAEVTSQVSHL